jgi:hypothetical protein
MTQGTIAVMELRYADYVEASRETILTILAVLRKAGVEFTADGGVQPVPNQSKRSR